MSMPSFGEALSAPDRDAWEHPVSYAATRDVGNVPPLGLRLPEDLHDGALSPLDQEGVSKVFIDNDNAVARFLNARRLEIIVDHSGEFARVADVAGQVAAEAAIETDDMRAYL